MLHDRFNLKELKSPINAEKDRFSYLAALFCQPDPVEEPEAEEEDEEEEGGEGAEEVDAGEGGAGTAPEHGPAAHRQDEQLAGEGDEQSVTLHLALEVPLGQGQQL